MGSERDYFKPQRLWCVWDKDTQRVARVYVAQSEKGSLSRQPIAQSCKRRRWTDVNKLFVVPAHDLP